LKNPFLQSQPGTVKRVSHQKFFQDCNEERLGKESVIALLELVQSPKEWDEVGDKDIVWFCYYRSYRLIFSRRGFLL